MAFQAGHALLIGVGSYAHAPHMDASLMVEDAKEVAKTLQDPDRAGYPANQVTLLHGAAATRQGVLDALEGLAQRAGEGDTALLFYVGHGDFDDKGAYYLTTHDTRWERGKVVPGTAIREDELLQALNRIRAKRAFLIFNSCHAGAISPSALGHLGGEPDTVQGVPVPDGTTAALLSTGEGRVVITACRETQRSYFLRTEPLSFFAEALSNGLQGRGVESRRGFISVFDLYSQVYDEVKAEIEKRSRGSLTQEPELTLLKGVGPMAIALHRGKEGVGALGPDDAPQALPEGLREVEASESQARLQQILSGTIQHSLVAGRDARQAGRDLIEGDQWVVQGEQGVIAHVSGGTVNQHFDNRIEVSALQNSVVAIGRGASVNIRYYPIELQSPLRGNFDSLIEDRVRLFAGRVQALQQIGKFIEDEQGGYLVVTAPGGFGKTALMARLIHAQPEAFAYHFFYPSYESTLQESFFLRSVVEQMAAWHQHAPWYDKEWKVSDDADRLRPLFQQFLETKQEATQILILDGLDAIQWWDTERYLFKALPDNIHIILTLDDSDEPWQQQIRLPAQRVVHLPLAGLNAAEVRELLRQTGSLAVSAMSGDEGLVARILEAATLEAHPALGASPALVRRAVEALARGEPLPQPVLPSQTIQVEASAESVARASVGNPPTEAERETSAPTRRAGGPAHTAHQDGRGLLA